MASILYYVVQVESYFYQKTMGDPILTDNEEQAFAFMDRASAKQLAIEVNGNVLTREVSDEELEELSVHHWTEYQALPKEERNRIEAFCRELQLGMND